MEFARKVWKLLVAIKDGLVLVFMLLFFVALYGVLSARPGVSEVHKGALLIKLDGFLVEEPSAADPLAILLSGEAPVGEYRARDVARALRLAAKDDRIKAVALDLSGFLGGGLVHLEEVGAALDEVRAAKKPVYSYSVAYLDDALLLAAHTDEVWVNPMGGAFVTGPGGNNLYFSRLLDKLNINVRIFRVGTFKSAVEPYMLNGPSDATREAYAQVYGAMWEAWKADVAKARPKADIAAVIGDPVGWLKASGGDAPEAGKAAGLIDRIGSRTDFGLRVAEVAGEDPRDKAIGNFAHTGLRAFLSANRPKQPGKAIGVVTIAGQIVDGGAGPGAAGGDRIAGLLNTSLDKDLAALVIRIDSPGGSVAASEQIRAAIERYRQRKIPVVVSMGNVAASGGYWVSTPAERIFAEPATITGSIGIFAIIPTFERTLADLGVSGGGVKTTPLSGQPDPLTGFAPEMTPMIQAVIENGYSEFVGLVSKSRSMDAAMAKDWAEGRPWDGGTARQLGLVDEFGGLDDALAFAAKKAGLKEGDWHAEFIGEKAGGLAGLLKLIQRNEDAEDAGDNVWGPDLAALAARQQVQMVRRAINQADWLLGVRGMQALCLECPMGSTAAAPSRKAGTNLRDIGRLIGLAP